MDAIGRCKPSECVMVGDNKALDVEAAEKAGLQTIWVHPLGDVKSVTEISPALIRKLEK